MPDRKPIPGKFVWFGPYHILSTNGVDRGGITMEPKKLMDVGRLGILEDPTGAALALMKPNPQANR